jgi:hypothetical protein
MQIPGQDWTKDRVSWLRCDVGFSVLIVDEFIGVLEYFISTEVGLKVVVVVDVVVVEGEAIVFVVVLVVDDGEWVEDCILFNEFIFNEPNTIDGIYGLGLCGLIIKG